MKYQKITAYAALCTLCAVALFGLAPLAFAQNEALVEANTEFNQRGYFTARQDFRTCPSPHCGGYWLKRVNRELTRCVDGQRQKECYVAEIIGIESIESIAVNQLLLRGKIEKREVDAELFEGLGVFVPKEGFVAASSIKPTGTFVGLADNGIRCITAPCPHYDEFKLNSARSMLISGINFGEFEEVESAQVDKAREILFRRNGVLLATGVNKQVKYPHGFGITFDVSQFYLPLKFVSVSIDQSLIWPRDEKSVSFTLTGAEVGTTYVYTFSSIGGGTPVTGSGIIDTATEHVRGIDISGLAAGRITLSVTLTNDAGNVGPKVFDTSVKLSRSSYP